MCCNSHTFKRIANCHVDPLNMHVILCLRRYHPNFSFTLDKIDHVLKTNRCFSIFLVAIIYMSFHIAEYLSATTLQQSNILLCSKNNLEK